MKAKGPQQQQQVPQPQRTRGKSMYPEGCSLAGGFPAGAAADDQTAGHQTRGNFGPFLRNQRLGQFVSFTRSPCDSRVVWLALGQEEDEDMSPAGGLSSLFTAVCVFESRRDKYLTGS